MNNRGYRIVFMGTPDFAVPCLEALLNSEHQVAAVVTQPDRKKGRGKKVRPPPVKDVAQTADIPVLQPTRIKTESFAEALRSYRPDVIVVVAYGRILPASILTLPPLGCINVHGSLLPRHRGAAPIQWAVLAGDQHTGVTIMQMDEGMDTGDILQTAAIELIGNETAGDLFHRLAALGAPALLDTLAALQNGTLHATPQNHDQATKAAPLTKEMGCVDWSKPAQELHRLVRGLDPWPSAYTYLGGTRYRLFAPSVVCKKTDAPAGTILLADDNGILVATGHDCLLIHELQPEGKKRVSAEAFLCGHTLAGGSRFKRQTTS
ncbi:MAG: methionyl-tRNA formyltransferase [Desulfopila sp.]